jgi:hypothetical protein
MPKTTPPLLLQSADGRMQLGTFLSLGIQREYIDRRTRELWPAKMIDNIFPPIVPLDAKGNPLRNPVTGKVVKLKASEWLDRYNRVDQQVWAPGEPEIILDRVARNSGWRAQPGARCFNRYDAPTVRPGDPTQATPWTNHVHKVYAKAEANHIIKWLAFKVQNPGVKINHALVLGGSQGIGKDTILAPLVEAVGSANFGNISPSDMTGVFNRFVESVILRVSEARDLGENTRVNRFTFYDHSKVYAAAPPEVLRCNEKHIRPYYVFNVLGMVLTTNHRFDGLYLPADDRRHYVAWSELTKDDFATDYWTTLWRWYDAGGYGHVAAYLRSVNLTGFDPKAPPPRTQALLDIIDTSAAPENNELADAIEELMQEREKQDDKTKTCTLAMIAATTKGAAMEWLLDRKSRRMVPHRMAEIGYIPVRNPDEKDGRWRIGGARHMIYGPVGMPLIERLQDARNLVLARTKTSGSS